jgi:hypothetical protein
MQQIIDSKNNQQKEEPPTSVLFHRHLTQGLPIRELGIQCKVVFV